MRSRPALLIVLTFLGCIALGAVALAWIGFGPGSRVPDGMAALFTSVSAVCVTGLSVVDLSRDADFTAQLVILILIQIGGLGVLTLSNWILLSLRGRVGVYGSILSHETLGSLSRFSPSWVLNRVVVLTLLFEGLGTAVLLLRFWVDHSFEQALWLAVFHSVSAFCNAGFSLFADSLVQYYEDPVVNLTVMALIVTGGLGFVATVDILEQLRAWTSGTRRKLALNTRVALSVSAKLTVLGFALFLVFEWGNTFSAEGLDGEVFESLFLSVTARTAGFNTVHTSHLTNMTLLLLMFLMVVGASPGSTGGGVKTTSAAILWALVRGQMLNRRSAELNGHSVPRELVAKALALLALYGLTAILAMVALQATEFGELPHDATRGLFLEHLFEVISALSTVGLSTGITTRLSSGGLVVLMFCMFIGRVGPLVLASSLIGERRPIRYSLPEGDVMVG